MRKKVKDPERVAGHMFRMGIMSLVLEDPDKSDDRILDGPALIVSILHDVAECIVGDITPQDDVTPQEKHDREIEAMAKLVKKLPGPLAKELYEAFERYENQVDGDEDARLTKDLDKFDMILQAFEYEEAEKNRGKFLQEFFDSTKGVFKTEIVRNLVKVLHEQRNAC